REEPVEPAVGPSAAAAGYYVGGSERRPLSGRGFSLQDRELMLDVPQLRLLARPIPRGDALVFQDVQSQVLDLIALDRDRGDDTPLMGLVAGQADGLRAHLGPG